MDINKLLKRAADFYDMMPAEDKLDAMIRNVLEDELSENELDFVAAARNNQQLFELDDDWGKNN